MYNSTVLFDYFDDELKPILLIIDTSDPTTLDESTIYISLDLSVRKHISDWEDDGYSFMMHLEDLVINDKHSDDIGISLDRLKSTCDFEQFDLNEINNLVIRIADIEEVLQIERAGNGAKKHSTSRRISSL